MLDAEVFDAELPPTKNSLSMSVIKGFGLLVLSFFLLCSLFLYHALGESVTVSSGKVESAPQSITGDQIKPYLEEHFQQARWYSLIESIETEGKKITLRTYIFPDEEGRELADEIVDDLLQQGISGDIIVYGRNVSYYLLTHRSSLPHSVIGGESNPVIQ